VFVRLDAGRGVTSIEPRSFKRGNASKAASR